MGGPGDSFFHTLALPLPPEVRETGEQGDVEPRRMVRHPDSHQLFIGNLPHEVDKSELKDFFQSRCRCRCGHSPPPMLGALPGS